MSFGEKILKYQDDILRDLATLVSIPSVRSAAEPGMPFGRESTRALQTILSMAEGMGLSVKNVDNYAGHAEYGEGEETAAVLAHVDVVPAGDGWEGDPFVMSTRDGHCFGRGTADDKRAAIVALYCLKVLKEEQVPAKRRLRVVFGAAEETGSEDLAYYYQKEPLPVMGFTPDADYGICNREKGRVMLRINSSTASSVVRSFSAGTVVNAVPGEAKAELCCTAEQVERLVEAARGGRFAFEPMEEGVRVTAHGTSAHAMQPQEGDNAASRLITLLASVFSEQELGSLLTFLNRHIGMENDGTSLGVRLEDAGSGPVSLNLGLVSVSEEGASFSIDIRYPVTKDGNWIASRIAEQVEAAGLTVAERLISEPLYLPGDSQLVRLVSDAYQAVMGQPAALYATGGGTYARALRGNGVAFGPFFADEPDRRLHNTGENIELSRFMQHAQICLEAMYRVLTA